MYVNWKPLLFLGFIFWIILFATDVLERHKAFEPFIPEPSPVLTTTKKIMETVKSPSVDQSSSEEKLNSNFGLTMLFANIFIFVFSLIFCSIAKFLGGFICKGKSSEKLDTQGSKKHAPALKCPTVEDMKEPLIVTASDSAIVEKKALTVESSCPNLSTKMRGQSHQTCQTIFHAPLFTKTDQALKAECAKLREELLALHSNSIKEHALLSRKLESMAKEKRELSKRLSVVQKENQVAKTQLDELMNEKKALQKRIDNATKEFRVNTKTKKVALAKLEEITSTVEDLKRQLEQVTRDKEILQEKLQVLRNEYEQMQERMRLMQLKVVGRRTDEQVMAMEMEKAERDENTAEKSSENLNDQNSIYDSSQCSLEQNIDKESVFLPYVLSQTEVDMKNIQMKILQLEKSLKSFTSKSDMRNDIINEMKAEPDIEMSLNKCCLEDDDFENDMSEPSPQRIIPRGDIASRTTYDEIKVQALRSALREKIKVLENMKERGDESTTTGAISETGDEDYELSSEENISSPRMVSNSVAFQRFLKNIGAEAKIVSIGDSKFNSDCK